MDPQSLPVDPSVLTMAPEPSPAMPTAAVPPPAAETLEGAPASSVAPGGEGPAPQSPASPPAPAAPAAPDPALQTIQALEAQRDQLAEALTQQQWGTAYQQLEGRIAAKEQEFQQAERDFQTNFGHLGPDERARAWTDLQARKSEFYQRRDADRTQFQQAYGTFQQQQTATRQQRQVATMYLQSLEKEYRLSPQEKQLLMTTTGGNPQQMVGAMQLILQARGAAHVAQQQTAARQQAAYTQQGITQTPGRTGGPPPTNQIESGSREQLLALAGDFF